MVWNGKTKAESKYEACPVSSRVELPLTSNEPPAIGAELTIIRVDWTGAASIGDKEANCEPPDGKISKPEPSPAPAPGAAGSPAGNCVNCRFCAAPTSLPRITPLPSRSSKME